MADIDSIISGVSGNTRADFSGIPKIADAYYKSRDEAAKNDLRDAFKGGVPTLPDGSIDYGAMQRTLYEKGDVANGNAFVGISQRATELNALNGVDSPQQPTVGPSTSRNTVTADPSKRMDTGTGQPSQQPQQAPQPQAVQRPGNTATGPNSIVGIVGDSIPAELAGPIIQQVSAMARLDPNAPINDPQTLARVTQVAQAAIARAQSRQPQQQPAPPQAAPGIAQPVQIAEQNDPVLRRLTLLAASPDKQIAAAAKVRLESYLKNRELTPDQKNAAASGQSLTDYQNRGDENTTQRDILTKSLIPKIEKSQESASAARNDIDAIHRSREELDRGGTKIFSGPFAEKRLALAKIADVLGVPNADRIEKTEAFSAAIGSRVAAMVKAFGSGTAISDGDRRFAAAMSGGNIELNEASIRRILDIGERAGGLIIDRHNKQVDKVVSANEALKQARETYIVEPPGAYKKPDASSAVYDSARAAIAKGAPKDAVMKRLRENGHDPSKL